MKGKKIAAVAIGVVLSIVLVGGGYIALQNVASRADDVVPRDVIISQIGQNDAQVGWTTGQETQGVIEYGTSPAALSFFAPESAETLTHTVDLTLLSPSTTYYFQIRIADTVHDNGGVPWTFTTKSVASDTNPSAESSTGEGSTTSESSSSNFVTSPTCNETDCEAIRDAFFSGCDTQDYIRCLKAQEASIQ